jgi:hypothetical protein
MTPTRLTPDSNGDALVVPLSDADASDVPEWDMAWDIVDEWGAQSFPASDPPANW